jgi:hypothetical protein
LRIWFDVPEPDSLVAGAWCDESSTASKVKGVNILIVAIKGVSDSAAFNIPDTNTAILRSGSQELAIRGKADRPNVEITILVSDRIVLQLADSLAITGVENLSTSVASSSYITSIMGEAHTAYNWLVNKIVKKLYVENTRNIWVEDGVPILALSLEVVRKSVGI